ncbi:hypothetical protein E2C01_034464 [Portunus trituberculatus]|uniref:Uncharacterized protein n=1 Tax=Portunus trituberculatus TaxID=210409 RepID=A0A5B7F0P2_PORTR|nr:hypothetical protein [Portunus trituberculatus]
MAPPGGALCRDLSIPDARNCRLSVPTTERGNSPETARDSFGARRSQESRSNHVNHTTLLSSYYKRLGDQRARRKREKD